MIRLLKVEMGRLMSRRLFRVAAVAGLIAVLAVDGLIAAKSDKNVAAAEKRASGRSSSGVSELPRPRGQGWRLGRPDEAGLRPGAAGQPAEGLPRHLRTARDERTDRG